ncbi:type II secretion system F family protein [Paenibacillus larvae]|uniref:Putative Flp pilus assembly protein TadB n=1 Tax=Paenibacillus larvae subsp. larvae TaxID=147375 RepID=A0A6C0QUH8_9BACL|nr:type II secretion system F family protein [Paenibacillus larvae]QHZ52384.1 putative Flp pilus assembly protein TadB [Paenibacillus larvae subsp. larvae]
MNTILLALGIGGMIFVASLIAENKRKQIGKERAVPAKPYYHGQLGEKSEKKPKDVFSGLTDYNHYAMSSKQKILTILVAGTILGIVGFIFYNQIIMAFLFAAGGCLTPKYRNITLMRRRKEEMNQQFKQALQCLSTSLSAGKSVENTFRDTLQDLELLYPDPSAMIVQEFGVMVRRLDNGEPIEACILGFAERAGLEDITNFADVFITCKRTGGNLIEVIRRTSHLISEKLQIVQEISVMVAQKKFESKIMLTAPVAIIGILCFSSPDYMKPLYEGAGRLIMTIGLTVLFLCLWITKKIMDIKV